MTLEKWWRKRSRPARVPAGHCPRESGSPSRRRVLANKLARQKTGHGRVGMERDKYTVHGTRGEEPERRYPVVYLLDGDTLFPMLAPQHLLLTYDEKLPEAIVVGIAYGSFAPPVNRRDYDFSPPTTDAGEGQGGAPAFLRFLKTELIPQVEARVRADSARRVLLGQSRSGYMVLWSAHADPDLFWGRIASNPAVSPGGELLFAAPAVAPTRDDLAIALVGGTRDGNPRRLAAMRAWGERWEEAGDAPWAANLIELEGGTHSASIGEAYRQAMLWLFGRERR